jgi:hypothetical protein
MKLSKDLKEFVELLNSAKVRYVIVGGHAVAFHGYPRFTGDTDFFVERSPENAKALLHVVNEFGYQSQGFNAEDFLEPGVVIQLGRPPNRIDILTSIDGAEFAEVWATRVPTSIEGMEVPFICKDLLIRNKQASGRAQDIADLQKLK